MLICLCQKSVETYIHYFSYLVNKYILMKILRSHKLQSGEKQSEVSWNRLLRTKLQYNTFQQHNRHRFTDCGTEQSRTHWMSQNLLQVSLLCPIGTAHQVNPVVLPREQNMLITIVDK